MLARESSTRRFECENAFSSTQPAKRIEPNSFLRPCRGKRERVRPKGTCDVCLDTRGETCQVCTWRVCRKVKETLCSACYATSVYAWRHFLSGRVRRVCEGLLELERKGVSLTARVMHDLVSSTDCPYDDKHWSFSFFKREQMRSDMPLCTLCEIRMLAREIARAPGNRSKDMPNFFAARCGRLGVDDDTRTNHYIQKGCPIWVRCRA